MPSELIAAIPAAADAPNATPSLLRELARGTEEIPILNKAGVAMIVVSSLLDPRWLVELEADALVG